MCSVQRLELQGLAHRHLFLDLGGVDKLTLAHLLVDRVPVPIHVSGAHAALSLVEIAANRVRLIGVAIKTGALLD